MNDPGVRILLVRHAQTADIGHRLTGRAQVDLNARGRGQARALAARLAPMPVRALFTSPLRRATATAAVIAECCHTPAAPVADLNEIDFGEWTGQSFADLQSDARWHAFHSQPETAAAPGGESLEEARARSVRVVTDLGAGQTGGAAVAVTHGDVIRLALASFLGMPLQAFRRLTVDPGSISEIWFGPGGPIVVNVNVTCEGAPGARDQAEEDT